MTESVKGRAGFQGTALTAQSQKADALVIEPLLSHRITLEDVMSAYPPKELLNYHPPMFKGDVLAIGRAIYEAQPQKAVDSWTRFIASISDDVPRGNLWLLPTYERMTYPYAVYWPLGCAFRIERQQGRRFDWFLWLDDDVLFDKSDVNALLTAARTHKLKFVAAVPYDRMPPYSPAIIEKIDGVAHKWVKAPASGTYPVAMTGFNMCLFHRSIFDLVPEPWFGVCGPSKGFSGVAPDWWWSIQMEKVGLQPWVCCDTNLTHLSLRAEANRKKSEDVFASQDVTKGLIMEDRTLYTSANTGAITIKPPHYPDGRLEMVQGDNL